MIHMITTEIPIIARIKNIKNHQAHSEHQENEIKLGDPGDPGGSNEPLLVFFRVTFGFIIATLGCYYGMNSGRGAQGVGRATKAAVVAASVLILAANYLLTEAFFTS